MPDMLSQIVHHLETSAALNDKVSRLGMTEQLRALQTWQTQRLLTTHQDLWHAKRFKPAMQFFIDELYGPKDFAQRDAQLAKVVPKMAKILPEKALVSLQAALRLNSLSLSLDIAMLETLKDKPLNRVTYFECYRKSGDYTQRHEQIQLLQALGLDLAQVVKIPGISGILFLARKPAKLYGVISLHEFLEKGFKSFKKLGKVSDFIDPIIMRETQMMDAIYTAQSMEHNPLPQAPFISWSK